MNALATDYESSTAAVAALIAAVRGKVVSFEGTDRRAHARYVVAIPSIVQPLDDELCLAGPAFCAATRDISIGGIALIHSKPIRTRFLEVRLMPAECEELNFLVEVLRCDELGKFFDSAGKFVLNDVDCV